ncbi:hypothetical protein [Pseudomonas sp. B26(2017)]|uniref:hypothetical protein n=1 Tax=Pseudomonas sp. B26(2017) TaxID=1981732 RepID=UPI000A1DF571|nr:hypothetical protein [Pseudomonas sp. B26(2017)]
MTLGISYALNQRLVVMGDLLISGDEREHDVSIPTVGNVTEVFPKGSGFSITGLTQKVIVISEDMVITWAGHEVAATMAIRWLRELAGTGLTPENVAVFLKQLPQNLGKLDLQLTGFFVYENQGYLVDFKEHAVESTNFTDLRLIGNGADVFEEMLGKYRWVSGASRGVEADRGEYLSITMALAGMLLELELKNQPISLLRYFGGGYEVVFGEAGAFRKLDDVTHVYWKMQVNEDGVGITNPFYIQKQFYRGNDLVIMPIRISLGDAARNGIVDDEVYVVREPGSNQRNFDLLPDDLPSYNSRNTCHYFIEGEMARVFTRFQYREDPKENDLTIVESDAGKQLKIRKSFLEAITTTVWNDPRWRSPE